MLFARQKIIMGLSHKNCSTFQFSVSSMSAPAQQQTDRGKCVFCRICDGVEPNNILHQVSVLGGEISLF